MAFRQGAARVTTSKMTDYPVLIGNDKNYVRFFHPGDWTVYRVSVRSGEFAASVECSDPTAKTIYAIKPALKRMHRKLTGHAEFCDHFNQFELRLEMRPNGQTEVSGKLEEPDYRDNDWRGNALTFEFLIDQTYLPDILADLKRIKP